MSQSNGKAAEKQLLSVIAAKPTDGSEAPMYDSTILEQDGYLRSNACKTELPNLGQISGSRQRPLRFSLVSLAA